VRGCVNTLAGASEEQRMKTLPENDELLLRLRDFHSDYFPRHQQRFQDLVAQGQHPKTLFIGCSDSRLVPYLLTGAGPGELFLVRNVGALVPPYDEVIGGPPVGANGALPPEEGTSLGAARRLAGLHGTTAAIEFAVLSLKVERIIVCGHSHCGAIRTAYEGAPAEAVALTAWLRLIDEALLPVQLGPEAFRRTEQRAVVLQLERLMGYPMVRREVEAGHLSIHGWHYVIEDGEVHVFDAEQGAFVPASVASHSGTGPYQPYVEHDGQILSDGPADAPGA
jgi:carbonic anhydrase